MQSDAKICGFCSYDLVKNEPAAKPKSNLLCCFAILALVILALAILAGISSIVCEGSSEQPVLVQ